MKKVKIGVIGCGGIANGKHLPSYKNNDVAELVAFCDIVPERAEKALKEYGCEGAKSYVDYKELISDMEKLGSFQCSTNKPTPRSRSLRSP